MASPFGLDPKKAIKKGKKKGGGGGGGGGGSNLPFNLPGPAWRPPAPAAPAPAPAAPPAAPAVPAPVFNQSAYDMFRGMLSQMGLPVGADIEAIIRRAVVDGFTPDQIELLIPEIQETASWNNRFTGWKQRVANGYNQISVGEYLNLENSYKRIMQSAGLPTGFYDDVSD